MAVKQILLVEGLNDLHVFSNLFQRHNLPEAFQIKNKEGISKLVAELDVELLASDLETLGVVVDADTNLRGHWQALRQKLESSGYEDLPDVPDEVGTIIVGFGLPKIGIWIMPDNRLNGMLEDFVAYLVPAEDELWRRAEQSVEAIAPEQRLFKHRVAKATIHTWLAWQEQPGMPLGSAIKMRYLDSDAPQAHLFIEWIRRLFLA